MNTSTTAPGALTQTMHSLRAEVFRVRRWSAVSVAVGAWLLLNALFGYVFNYISYNSDSANFSTKGESRATLLGDILPSGVAHTLVQGMPLFGGAIMMVIGALIAGSGYGWGTWKTTLTQGPSRVAVALGSLGATALVMIGVVVLTLVSDVLLSLGAAALTSHAVRLPSFGDLSASVGVAVLVMLMWGVIGWALGTITRGPALSVGLALVWALVIENLLRGVGTSISWIADFTHFLPGTAAGSLAGQLVRTGSEMPAPGLFTTLSSTRAAITMAAWLLIAAGSAVWLMRRRDVS